MIFGINTLSDFDVNGKTVLCRVDLNQPVDKKTDTLNDTTRIKASIPTISELADRGAKVVLLAHQGSDIEYQNYYTLRPHAKVLSELLNREILFIEDICGPEALRMIRNMHNGQVLLLDNVRFLSEEQTLFEKKLKLSHSEQANTLLVRKLAPLADLYVCDAFAAAHRSQPSLCGFEYVLPSAMGRLFEKEYEVLSGIMKKPERPCVFVLGGSKVGDAFTMMDSVLSNGIADKVLTGGLVGNIILLALGKEIGSGSVDFIEKSNNSEYVENARILYEKYGDKIMVPCDVAYVEWEQRRECVIGKVPKNISALDIGEKTIKAYQEAILKAQTVFVNGPMGVFENDITGNGTAGVWDAIAQTEGFTVIGGGDSITATKKYKKESEISYISTGGGSLIRFLSGEELPVVAALRHASKNGRGAIE